MTVSSDIENKYHSTQDDLYYPKERFNHISVHPSDYGDLYCPSRLYYPRNHKFPNPIPDFNKIVVHFPQISSLNTELFRGISKFLDKSEPILCTAKLRIGCRLLFKDSDVEKVFRAFPAIKELTISQDYNMKRALEVLGDNINFVPPTLKKFIFCFTSEYFRADDLLDLARKLGPILVSLEIANAYGTKSLTPIFPHVLADFSPFVRN